MYIDLLGGDVPGPRRPRGVHQLLAGPVGQEPPQVPAHARVHDGLLAVELVEEAVRDAALRARRPRRRRCRHGRGGGRRQRAPPAWALRVSGLRRSVGGAGALSAGGCGAGTAGGVRAPGGGPQQQRASRHQGGDAR